MNSIIGREEHLLLELFQYIVQNPEPSQKLYERLEREEPKTAMVLENVVF